MSIRTHAAGTIVADWSWARPNLNRLHALGVEVGMRYISYNKTGKNLTPAERDMLFAAGIDILLNWEAGAGDALGGAPVGAKHGADAFAQAQALGYPMELCIWVSVDVDTQPAQWPAIVEYFRAYKAACGYPLAAYCEAGLANLLLQEGLIQHVWAPAALAWNSGITYTKNDVQQLYAHKRFPQLNEFGSSIDDDVVLTSLEAWSGLEVPAAPVPAPAASGVAPGQPGWVPSADQIAAAKQHILVQGSQFHEAVMVAQYKLGCHVDGIFGPQTYKFTCDFQRAHHLYVDGKIGNQQTWPALCP
jgi:peptidoglycan hydrolase-like protein with peptidoglycan-binding domain